ncbi:ATP-binding protein [Microbacterium sp. 5K110]|uniref:ATP-binding protein n=1 Tax=unclassified Microbacterium TaxID=2609290 RepID=UPI0010FEE7FD|nr:ATP-binding protein [Microbacterium sp. 5K110]TLF33201.1 ATP-binding protein [Microbacterium sp. 5K110]
MPRRSSSPLVVDALGVRIGIDLSALEPPARAAVRSAWSGAVSAESAAPRTVVAPAASHGEGPMLAALSSAVTMAAIEARRGDLWMLHAAGVAGPDGGVVVLVGESGAGKTTAVRTLARTAGYVSDETVGIDASGTVLPYRKPLSVITEGVSHKVQRSPDELALGALPAAELHLSRLILLARRPGSSDARLVPVPTSEAIAELAGQSSALVQLRHPVRTMVELIDRTGGALRAEYGEVGDLAALLRDAASPSPSAGSEPADPAPLRLADPDPGSPGDGTRYQRADAVDWCALPDDRLAVLSGHTDGSGTLRVLAGVAPTLWRAASGVRRDELVAAVDAAFACPDPGEVTDRALQSLIEAGLLRASV